MANRLITAATIIALLTPLAACGNIGGGLAFEPEHQTRSIADVQLPDHIVNGDFEYPGYAMLKPFNCLDWWAISRHEGVTYQNPTLNWTKLPTSFDAVKFAWDSTESGSGADGQWNAQLRTNEVEIQRDIQTGNFYAELAAFQSGTAIKQTIATTPGVMYRIRLKHASQTKRHTDSMHVMVGPEGGLKPVVMTRTASENGLDKVGESGTLIATQATNEPDYNDSNSRHHEGQWATYEGTYLATGTRTVFSFESVSSITHNSGNLLDDISFEKAYPLSYDMNGGTGGPVQKQY